MAAKGAWKMFMNGEYLLSIDDLKRCFSIEELIYSYISGELEIWLRKIGEDEKAEQVNEIPKMNAYILFHLYKILDLDLDLSEEEIRSRFIHQKQS